MEELSDNTTAESGALNRRNVLKGAVAVGVGAAVWTVPSITSLGGTPAYAETCTGGTVEFQAGTTNTSCSCGSNPNKYVSYKPLSKTACQGDPRPTSFIVDLTLGATNSLVQNSGECPAPDGNVFARISGSNKFCVVKVVIHQGNDCGTTPIGPPVYSAIAPPGATTYVAMPQAPCQGAGNVFTSVGLVCATDEACLYQFLPK